MTAPKQKLCKLCAEMKTLDLFYHRADGSIENTCRKCRTSEERKHANATPSAYLRNIVNKARYGAKKRDLPFTITHREIMNIWDTQGGRCALSGVYMTYAKDGRGRKELNVSLDRIDPEGGYTAKPSNVQLVCYRVNIMKHVLQEHELFWWIKNICKNLNL